MSRGFRDMGTTELLLCPTGAAVSYAAAPATFPDLPDLCKPEVV
jgi:hypothetical protein